MHRRVFGASWGGGGSPDGALIGHTLGMVRKDSMSKSISNSSLDAMIPLGFVKGKNSRFGFGSNEYSEAVMSHAWPMVPFASAAWCRPESRAVSSTRHDNWIGCRVTGLNLWRRIG
jgi:hypothetical protein